MTGCPRRHTAGVIRPYRKVAGRAAIAAGHSLRLGFATSAARAGVPEASIQRQTGHKSLPALRGYVRRAELFKDHAGSDFL